jgi:hypothetical protein
LEGFEVRTGTRSIQASNCHIAGTLATASATFLPIQPQTIMSVLSTSGRASLTLWRAAVRRAPCPASSSIVASRPLPRVPSTSSSLTCIRTYAKKSKKGKGRDDDDDVGTTVIKTKGKASSKSGVSMSASKKSKGDLTAGEEPIDLGDVDAVDAHDEALVDKMKTKMEKTVSWCQGIVFDGVERGSGRVSPGEHLY